MNRVDRLDTVASTCIDTRYSLPDSRCSHTLLLSAWGPIARLLLASHSSRYRDLAAAGGRSYVGGEACASQGIVEHSL